MHKAQRTLSAHTQHTERSEDLNDEEEEKWFEVLPKPARQNKQLMQTPTNNMRALLEDLVLVIDIMPELLDQEIVSRDCYFGLYGQVTKSIFCIKTAFITKKPNNLAFISYKNQLDAALAIAALRNYGHKNYKCLISYGTSRYCPNFINGLTCPNPQCYFLHKLKEQTYTVQSIRSITKQQKLQKAYAKIRNNLTYFIKKEHQEFLNSKLQKRSKHKLVTCQCGFVENSKQLIIFPTVKETLSNLATQGIIDKEIYQDLKFQYKMKIKQKYQKKNIELSTSLSITPRNEENKMACDLASASNQEEQKEQKEQVQFISKKEEEPTYLNYLLQKFLHPHSHQLNDTHQAFQKQYNNRRVQLQENISNGKKTLLMYEKLVGKQLALNSYIHHKIIQEASWKHLPSRSLFPFAEQPSYSDETDTPSNQKFQKIVYESLLSQQ